jgi:hypothetical protein
MGQKRTPVLVSKAKQLRADGRSFAEVAAELSKGGRSVSKAAVMGWLKDSSGASAAVAAPPPAPPEATPEPLDESESAPDLARRTLSGLLHRLRDREARLTGAKDEVGVERVRRQMHQLARDLAKLESKDDEDGDAVRVSVADMTTAGEKAWDGLRKQGDAVIAERATWPKCPSCGQPRGEFTTEERSPIRALFERVAGRAP